MTGQEKIDYLIESLGAIKNRVTDGATMTVGATGYAALGGTIVDDAFNDALITGRVRQLLRSTRSCNEPRLRYCYQRTRVVYTRIPRCNE